MQRRSPLTEVPENLDDAVRFARIDAIAKAAVFGPIRKLTAEEKLATIAEFERLERMGPHCQPIHFL